MSGPSIVTEQLASSRAQDGRSWGSTLSEYWALTKPEVNFLILITTGVGFYLGCGSGGRPFSFAGLFNTLLGTLLVASGTGTLNQYIERTFDAQMRRTARRPAASGRLNSEAWTLYAILFLWQFPHFMAIAWMYREDYERAGYLVLPKGNARIPFVTLETLLPLLALVAISIVQVPTRHAAIFYCAGALLSLGFLYFGLEFVLRQSRAAARRLLAASIVYLPLLFVLSATLCNRA